MATTSATNAPAGTIDVQALVTQLMTIANRPVTKLNAHISTNQTKLSDFGTISGLVSGFQTAAKNLNTSLGTNSAVSSNSNVFSASAASTSAVGSYTLNITSLAQSQNLVSAGQASSTTAISNGVATTLSFDFGTTTGAAFATNGGGVKSITIDATNNTLQGISNAINAANLGVTATIVNDGSATTPFRISLTSNSTGASNSLKITATGGDGTINNLLGCDPAAAMMMTQTLAAQNANFTVNGVAISSNSNTVTTAIQGVTLNLSSVTTTPVTLSVAHDSKNISAAIAAFADNYNALYNQLKSRSAYATATSAGGSLAGNGTLRTMISQMQGLFSTPAVPAAGGSLSYLAQAGISIQKDGTMKVDSTVLNNVMNTNFSDLTNLLSSTSGFATRVNTWTKNVLSPGNGLIPTATDSINTSISNDNTQIDQLQARMRTLQAQYTKQYTSLNMLLSNMSGTSTYLSQQLR